MANNGSLVVDIESLEKICSDVSTQSNKIIENYYEQFKKLYILSNSSYIKGDYADALKTYLQKGIINLNSGIMDVVAAIQAELEICYKNILEIESDNRGVISEERITSINNFLNEIKNGYAYTEGEIFGHLCEASSYIPTSDVPLDDVKQAFDWTGLAFFDICNSIEQFDQFVLLAANAMYDRIINLKNQVISVRNNCYSGGYLNLNCGTWLDDINNNPQLPTVALDNMKKEHPFDYVSDGVCVSEDQWVAGLSTDTYAYAGYSLLSASYEKGYGDNSAFIKAKASVLETNAYAQLTDYASVTANVKLLYGEGEAKAGWGDGYYGARASGEVGVAKVDASAMFGNEYVNIKGNAYAKAACADGSARFEFEPEDGTFDIGFDGNATGAAVGAGVSVGGFDGAYGKYQGKDMEKPTNLFGAKASVSAGPQVGIGAGIRSQKAIETEYFNVNALSVNVNLKVLGGIDLSVQVPTIYPKFDKIFAA